MATRYRHRKPTAAEFIALMKRAGMNINDFLAVTGRHGAQVMAFLRSVDVDNGTKNLPYSPTMGDVLILELAARDPALVDTMTEIANVYAIDEPDPMADGPPDRYWK